MPNQFKLSIGFVAPTNPITNLISVKGFLSYTKGFMSPVTTLNWSLNCACPKCICNAFKMLLFVYKHALGQDPLPYLVFLRKFPMNVKTTAKFFSTTKPLDLMGCQILSFSSNLDA